MIGWFVGVEKAFWLPLLISCSTPLLFSEFVVRQCGWSIWSDRFWKPLLSFSLVRGPWHETCAMSLDVGNDV